ncbi:MAG: hypothetical protein EZS28_021021 [Streblomastix strix]|uniref:Uncharacterized protein n=1 Tax=Streblomastix strix TaxID=222440 RepID=A0A5J4VLJ9_9EUKA|nr:MAG: hypothetical protein EZS28_021021 [Streblomastix strix]
MTQLSALKQQIQIKPTDNRDQLVDQGALNQICAVLREGMKEEDEYSGVVLFGCEIASLLLKDNKRVIQAALEDNGLVDSLVTFLHSILQDKIMPDHIQILYHLLICASKDQKKLLYDKQVMRTIFLSLNTTNEQKLEIFINKINQIILNEGEKLKEGQQYPYKAQLEVDGTFSRLTQLLLGTDITNSSIKYNAAITIGTIFKATILPKEINSIVIKQIKQDLEKKNDQKNQRDLIALKCIAECKCVL